MNSHGASSLLLIVITHMCSNIMNMNLTLASVSLCTRTLESANSLLCSYHSSAAAVTGLR